MGGGGSSRDRFAFSDGPKSFVGALSNLGVALEDSATLHTPVNASALELSKDVKGVLYHCMYCTYKLVSFC